MLVMTVLCLVGVTITDVESRAVPRYWMVGEKRTVNVRVFDFGKTMNFHHGEGVFAARPWVCLFWGFALGFLPSCEIAKVESQG